MAKRGQFPLCCQLCESNTHIEFKCVDCNLLMCRTCTDKTHIKFKNSKDHKVISTKEIGRHEVKMNFSDLKCSHHTKSCCFYCTTCDVLVCPTCVLKDHKEHELVEISEGYELLKSIYEMDKKEFETQLVEAASLSHNLRQLKKNHIKKMSGEILKIERHGDVLKQSVDQFVKEMKNAIKSEGSTIIQAVEEDFEKITNTRKHGEKMVEYYQTVIDNTDVVTFFRDACVYKSPELSFPIISSIYQSVPDFIPSYQISQSNVGKLIQTTCSSDPHMQVFKQTKQYLTNLTSVNAVCPTSDGTVWLSSIRDKVLQQVKPAKKLLEVLKSFKREVDDIALVSSKDILVACEGKPQLQWMNGTLGKLSDSVYDVKPLQPIMFSMTESNGVIVRALNDTSDKRTVIVLDSKGRQTRVFDTDEEHEALFNCPIRVKSTRNGFIHVVDCMINCKIGKITVLNEEGRLINAYCGHSDVNRDVLFCPQGIAITPRDNVLVSDIDTHYLHVLNNRGYLLSVINVGDIGISHPLTLTFDSIGTLYIGCSTKLGVKNPSAQLCIIKSPSI